VVIRIVYKPGKVNKVLNFEEFLFVVKVCCVFDALKQTCNYITTVLILEILHFICVSCDFLSRLH